MQAKLIEIARTLENIAEKYKPPLEVLGQGRNRVQLSANFSLHEFECRHCGAVMIDSELVRRLQTARDKIGRPLVVTSGYRCPAHNKAVGGAANSQHLYGKAADVTCPDVSPGQLYDILEPLFPDGGAGLYPGFVHVDIRDEKARWTG